MGLYGVSKSSIVNDQEEAFVKTFICEEKRERYLGFIASPKNRVKFLKDFYHNLLPAICCSQMERVPNRDQRVDLVAQKLKEKGSTAEVYLVSPNDQLDQRWISLEEAITVMFGDGMGSLACCLKGELAFFHSETSVWILHNPKPKA